MYKYQQGGAIDDSREQIYNALMQQGVLGGMSYEEFQSMPPQQLRQLMQGVRQQMETGDRTPSGPTMGPAGQLNSGIGAGGPTIMGTPPTGEGGQETGDGFNMGALNAGIQGTTMATGMIGSAIKNPTNSTGSAENVAGDVMGGAANGATAGAAFGPWGALIGGVAGGVMGGVNNAQGQAKEKALVEAGQRGSNVGSLGTQLNPMVAAYGARIAERSLVNKMQNRADNPQYYDGNYSTRNKAGAGVSTAGMHNGRYFNDRQTYQEGANIPATWEKPIKPKQVFNEYFKTPWDRSNKYSEYKATEDAKRQAIELANQQGKATYANDMQMYNQSMNDLSGVANMYNKFNAIPQEQTSAKPVNTLYQTAGHAGNPLYRRNGGYVPSFGAGGEKKKKKC